jgi:predicted PurR-regulated permease PerM
VSPLLDARLRLPAHTRGGDGPTVSALSWTVIGRLVVAGFGVWALIQTWQLWIMLLVALILASALLPAARWGDRRGIPRLATVVGVYGGVALVFVALGRFLVPALVEQAGLFAKQLPALLAQGRAFVEGILAWGARWDLPMPSSPGNGDALHKIGQALAENTLRATAGVVGAVVGTFLVLVLAAYLVLDAERIGASLARLLPRTHRARAAALAPPVLAVMGGYVRGQLVVSLCVGSLIAVGLALLGVPYWLLIGAIAFALNVVPFLGSPAAAVLGILSALTVSPMLALWSLLLFWGTNLLEGKLLVPYFVGRATGLHPVAVLLAILAGVQLAGLVGALVAVPLLAGAWEVLRTLHVEPLEAAEPGAP